MHPVPNTTSTTDAENGILLSKSPPIPTHQFGKTTNVTDIAPDFPSVQGKKVLHMPQQDSVESNFGDEEVVSITHYSRLCSVDSKLLGLGSEFNVPVTIHVQQNDESKDGDDERSRKAQT